MPVEIRVLGRGDIKIYTSSKLTSIWPMAEKITDIDGIGGNMADRLEAAGIETLDDLASGDPEELSELDGLSTSRAQRFINEAKESAVLIQTGEEVVEEYESLPQISTGVEELDDLLGGGWEAGFLVAVGGETGSGKTQLAFQALGEAVQQTGKPAVYIETERGRYRGNRIREMYDEETQKMVHKVGAYDLDQQLMAYRKVRNHYDELSAVVVDSFTSRFRLNEDFSGRENFTNRSDAFAAHLNELEELAAVHKIPILLTCQVYENVSGWGSGYVIYGGSLMMHTVNFVIMLKSRSGALMELNIQNHPEVGEEDLELQITEDGVHTPR